MFDFIATPLRAIGVYVVGLIATSSTPDANLILNLLMVLLLIVFGPRYLKTSILKKQIEELKSALDTRNVVIDSRNTEKQQLSESLQGAQQRANLAEQKCETLNHQLAEWKARYDEQRQYTAEPAIQSLNEVITGMAKSQSHFQDSMTTLHESQIELLRELTARSTGGQ